MEVIHRGNPDRGQNRSIDSSEGRPYKKLQTLSQSTQIVGSHLCMIDRGVHPVRDSKWVSSEPAADQLLLQCRRWCDLLRESSLFHWRCGRQTQPSTESHSDTEQQAHWVQHRHGHWHNCHSQGTIWMHVLRNLPSGHKTNTLWPEHTLPVKGKFTGRLKWGDTKVEEMLVIRCLHDH